ncbi:SoxR reducing system RseC family protein [Vibrio agarivorans]|uniref:SoxR reducing system RseC family protein n=1 Tax=Vibrio agarivorans TaxID=153622 RepID=A0ABT7Y1Y7_9VIBR|nr:SoxR reducing system RseC family protein [Vibrio agarivorans]MDN2482052.1 SoxR reducing system RseC family protein [Vibrio agarivorans]
MMTALAQVTAVQPAQGGWQATLSCEQKTSCSSCASKSSCGIGLVSNAIGNKSLTWQLVTEQSIQVGDTVEIGLPERKLLSFAAATYLMPLLFLVIGAIAGQTWLQPFLGAGEGAVILLGIVGAAIGFIVARQFVRKREKETSSQVVLLRILGSQIPVV